MIRAIQKNIRQIVSSFFFFFTFTKIIQFNIFGISLNRKKKKGERMLITEIINIRIRIRIVTAKFITIINKRVWSKELEENKIWITIVSSH